LLLYVYVFELRKTFERVLSNLKNSSIEGNVSSFLSNHFKRGTFPIRAIHPQVEEIQQYFGLSL
jgi:hypothetical protein